MSFAFVNGIPERPKWEAVEHGWRRDPPEGPEPRFCWQCDEWQSYDGVHGICRAKAYEWEQRALLPGTTVGDDPELAAEFAMQWVLGNLVEGDASADECDGWGGEGLT